MQISTSEKILNAAEELFAQSSYDAVSIRHITQKAGVKLALAHYHFGTKKELFDAVVKRRIGLLSQSRIQLLNHFLAQNDDQPLPIDKIVHAFVLPYLYWHLNGGEGWRNYARIVSTLLGYNLSLLQEQFDAGAHVFLRELRRTMHSTKEEKVQWGFDFMVGVMCNTFSEVDRIGGLTKGLCSIEDKEQACSYLIPFITSGLEQLASSPQADLKENLALLSTLILSF